MKQSTYRERAANGVCVKCGKSPPRTGLKLCMKCSIKESEQRHARYVRHQGGIERSVGRPNYEYAVISGDQVVFKGTYHEISEFLGYSPKSSTVYRYIGNGQTTPGGYKIIKVS